MAKIEMVYTRPSSTYDGTGYGEAREADDKALKDDEGNPIPSEVDNLRAAGFVTKKEFCDQCAKKAASEWKRGNKAAARAFAKGAQKLDDKHKGLAKVLKDLDGTDGP